MDTWPKLNESKTWMLHENPRYHMDCHFPHVVVGGKWKNINKFGACVFQEDCKTLFVFTCI